MEERPSYDEETLNEKVKRKAGILTLIGSGILSALHILSHVVPAIGILGLSFGDRFPRFYNFISSEYMQIAYLAFVVLSFWYIYRDHKHHEHERQLRLRINDLEGLLEKERSKYPLQDSN